MKKFDLPPNASMRDIFDYCTKHNMPSLAQGMIELPPPKKLRELVAKYAMDETVHTYRNRFGEKIYLNGIVNLLKQHYGTELEIGNLLATCGVTATCVASLIWMKAQNKNRIGIFTPFYTYHYKEIITIFGKDPTFVYLNDDYTINFDNLTKALKEGLDLIIFCNPGNPTTKVASQDDIDKLLDLTAQYNCYVLIDECYCDMTFGKTHYSPLPPLKKTIPDNLIIARGFSKVLGCQSWRVGYAIGSEKTIKSLMAHHDTIYICVPWAQHALGDFFLNHYDEFKVHCKAINDLMRNNWKILSKAFNQSLKWIPIEPEGSMYGLLKHGKEKDSDAVVEALEKGVGVCPNSIFYPMGTENTGHIRIHCGISEEKAKKVAEILLK